MAGLWHVWQATHVSALDWLGTKPKIIQKNGHTSGRVHAGSK